jgi:hypothetical protein
MARFGERQRRDCLVVAEQPGRVSGDDLCAVAVGCGVLAERAVAVLAERAVAVTRLSISRVIVSWVIWSVMVEPPLTGRSANQDQTKDQRPQVPPDRARRPQTPNPR